MHFLTCKVCGNTHIAPEHWIPVACGLPFPYLSILGHQVSVKTVKLPPQTAVWPRMGRQPPLCDLCIGECYQGIGELSPSSCSLTALAMESLKMLPKKLREYQLFLVYNTIFCIMFYNSAKPICQPINNAEQKCQRYVKKEGLPVSYGNEIQSRCSWCIISQNPKVHCTHLKKNLYYCNYMIKNKTSTYGPKQQCYYTNMFINQSNHVALWRVNLSTTVDQTVQDFGPNWNISPAIKWTAIKLCGVIPI